MKMNPVSMPFAIAQQGIQQGFQQLSKQSSDIAQSIIPPEPESSQPVGFNFDALNEFPSESLENSLVNMQRTKFQIQSLAKVIEVEKQLFDDSLGRIFDTKV